MKLVTVATHSERYYPYLKLSAEKYGHELITLGWGQKWQGFAWRFELMKNYLQSISPNENVCFVDGYDVIVLQDPNTIEKKFLNKVEGDTNKIFISKEQYSHNGVENTILSYLQSFVFTKCENEYINAGTYMGKSECLLNLFEKVCDEFKCTPNKDDQRMIQDYCTKYNNNFVIDVECDIFLVINSTLSEIKANEYNITFNNKTLIYKTNTFPAFFHGNGYTNFDYIIKELGYDTSIFKADGESKSKYIWNAFIHFFPVMIQRIWIYIFIFILIIVYVFRKSITKHKIRVYRFKR
jgi:hypothetical protein